MAFFSDLFNAVTGQQATPKTTIINTKDLLNDTYSTMQNTVAPGVINYNKALAPGLMDVQLGVEKQYDPNAANLRAATSKSILDELNLGNSISPELQDLITQNTLQGVTSSGIGTSDMGQLFGARSLLSAGLDLGRTRRNEALDATKSQRTLGSLYQNQGFIDPLTVASDFRNVQAAKDEADNLAEDIRRNNFASLVNTGGRIIGGIAGGIMGGPMGAQMGSAALGNIAPTKDISRGGGAASGGGGGNAAFSSILSGLMGGGGGRFVPGTGGRPDAVTAGALPFNGAFV